MEAEYVFALLGFVTGISPVLYSYIKDKTRWSTEKGVSDSQALLNNSSALENIVHAASMLAEQSQTLHDKSNALNKTFESALASQVEMTELERARRLELEQETVALKAKLDDLQRQIEHISAKMVACSEQIIDLIDDLQSNRVITNEKLERIKCFWE